MIRLPRDMSHDDVNQWLAGGIYLVRIKPRGGTERWEPCKWVGMDAGRVVSCALTDAQIHRTAHTSCAAVWPEMGSFNSPHGYAVHMGRLVERQYRRTYHQRMVEVTAPWAYRAGNKLGLDPAYMVHWSNVYDLPFRGVFPASVDEALSWIEDGKPTVAVNRRLVIAGDSSTDKRLFYLDGTLAANVSGGVLIGLCDEARMRAITTMLEGRYNVI